MSDRGTQLYIHSIQQQQQQQQQRSSSNNKNNISPVHIQSTIDANIKDTACGHFGFVWRGLEHAKYNQISHEI